MGHRKSRATRQESEKAARDSRSGAWTQWALFTWAGADRLNHTSTAGRKADGQFCPRCPQRGGDRPTWEGRQAAGQGAAFALRPIPLLQLALQGVELAVSAVDEVLGAPFCLHLDDKNLGQRPGVGPRRPGTESRRCRGPWVQQGLSASAGQASLGAVLGMQGMRQLPWGL